jgi:hypothetical protein
LVVLLEASDDSHIIKLSCKTVFPMANPEHLAILQQGVEKWNGWREANRDVKPDREADLTEANLSFADLSGANLTAASLNPAAKLHGTNLSEADLNGANLNGENYSCKILIQNLICWFARGQMCEWSKLCSISPLCDSSTRLRIPLDHAIGTVAHTATQDLQPLFIG